MSTKQSAHFTYNHAPDQIQGIDHKNAVNGQFYTIQRYDWIAKKVYNKIVI